MVQLTYRQELALKSVGYGMKTKRLRKKLFKYPERYVRLRNLKEMFDFEYRDALIEMIPNANNLLKLIPKYEDRTIYNLYNDIYQPVVLGMKHGYGVIDE